MACVWLACTGNGSGDLLPWQASCTQFAGLSSDNELCVACSPAVGCNAFTRGGYVPASQLACKWPGKLQTQWQVQRPVAMNTCQHIRDVLQGQQLPLDIVQQLAGPTPTLQGLALLCCFQLMQNLTVHF